MSNTESLVRIDVGIDDEQFCGVTADITGHEQTTDNDQDQLEVSRSSYDSSCVAFESAFDRVMDQSIQQCQCHQTLARSSILAKVVCALLSVGFV